MPTTTEPTTADLAAEVAQLRAELQDLRAELACEVRTRRIVVVDEYGQERITSSVRDHSTKLDIQWGEYETGWAETSLYAGSGPYEGTDAEAVISASTGDDRYAILHQTGRNDGGSEAEVWLVADGTHDMRLTINAPATVVADKVLTVDDAARALQLVTGAGQPNRRAVHNLIRSGAIRIVDPNLPISQWTVSSAEIERYIAAR